MGTSQKLIDSPSPETQRISISLTSSNIRDLENASKEMLDAARAKLIPVSGPFPLPTKTLRVTTRKSPCGNGTATLDKFEMRIHKRAININSTNEIARQIISCSREPRVKVNATITDCLSKTHNEHYPKFC